MWIAKNRRCENALHDYPIAGNLTFGQVSTEAAKRMVRGWKNPECPDCGMFGWVPPEEAKDGQA